MKRWNQLTCRVTALALAAATALPMVAQAGEVRERIQQRREKRQAEAQETGGLLGRLGGEEVRQLEVFELEHRDPQELNRIIALGQREMLERKDPSALPDEGPVRVPPGDTQARGFRGLVADERKVVTAINPEAKLLFVRGSKDQLKAINKLVTAFDVKDEKLDTHEYEGIKLVPVRTDDTVRLRSALNQLDLLGQEMITVGDVHFIVFHAADDKAKMKQAEEVIATLSEVEQEQDQQDAGQDANGQDRQDGDERAALESGQEDQEQ